MSNKKTASNIVIVISILILSVLLTSIPHNNSRADDTKNLGGTTPIVLSTERGIIDGNTVFIDNNHLSTDFKNTNGFDFYLSATPHTISSAGWVEFKIISNTYQGNTDLVLGFTDKNVKPTITQVWQNYTHYLQDYKEEKQIVKINGSDVTKTVGVNYNYTKNYFDWNTIKTDYSIDKYTYKNIDTWYTLTQYLEKGKEYRIRIWIDMPFAGFNTLKGEYYFAVKKTSDQVSKAIGDNNFFYLDPWWNASWNYSKKITLDHTLVPSTQTNFPICINITDTDLKNHAQSDGDDICFIASDNVTQYNHEIEWYNTTTGRLVAWVNITSLSSVSDTIIYMYFGNPSASSQEHMTNTWDTGFYGVYHMEMDGNNDLKDSTVNNNTAPDYISPPTEYTMSNKLGYQVYFPGGSTNAPHFRTPFEVISTKDITSTVNFFAYDTSVADGHLLTFHKGNQIIAAYIESNRYKSYIVDDVGFKPLEYINESTRSCILTNKVVENDKMYTYADGVLKNNVVISSIDKAQNLGNFIGCLYNDGGGNGRFGWKGYADEIRISSISRSENWIITEHNSLNKSYDGGFFTMGSLVNKNSAPILTGESPSNDSVFIQRYPKLSVYISDSNGDTLSVFWYTNASGSWTKIQTNASVSPNATFVLNNFTVANKYITKYWWRVNVNDGTTNDSVVYHFTTKASPVVTTNPAIGIEETNATIRGTLTSDNGESCSVWFEYGLTTGYGSITSITSGKVTGNTFNSNISGLTPATVYHYRTVANNTNGTSYGSDKMFSTKPLVPSNLAVGTIKTTSKLRVSWNNASKGTGVNMTTYIRYSTSSTPLTRSDGVFLYNGTGNSTNITNWIHATTYYVSAWHYITGGSSAHWSDSYSSASYTTPTTVHVFAVTVVKNNSINLSWTNGAGKTVIVRNATIDPTSPDNGIKVYNGTATTFSDTGLIPSHKYYYRAFCFNTTWGYNPDNCSLNQYTRPNKPYNTNTTVVSYNSINITWLNGTGTTSTIIRKSTTSQPLTITDGTQLYNGTLKYKVDTSITGTNNYYTLFSYNSTTHLFSEATPLIWYVVWVNVYNEVNNISITNWNISFSNPAGTQTYTKKGCSNPTLFNISNIPQGTNIGIFVSAKNYDSRQYYQDITIHGNYNINLYLSPVNNTHLYYCQVVNTYSIPLKSVLMQFKVSLNGSAYTIIDQLLTDDNGYVNLFLQSGINYKVVMTKTGYDTSISDWTPDVTNYGIYYPKIFVMHVTETNYTHEETVWDNISYTYSPENRYQNNSFNLFFNITSSNSKLNWYASTLYFWNTTTSVWNLLSSFNQSNAGGGSQHYTVPNTVGKYCLVSAFKKTGFSIQNMGYQYWYISVPPSSSVRTQGIPDNIYLGITIIVMMLSIGAAAYFAGATAGVIGVAVEGIMFAMRPNMLFNGVSCWFIFLATALAYFFVMFLRSRY